MGWNGDALFEHRELIDEFVTENPAKLEADELEIVGYIPSDRGEEQGIVSNKSMLHA